jgi:EAL domain-containing protein (putative c-di-GMP-specific phosphodiesterase class I)
MVIPGDFIPLFERNGQIGLIDRHVWAQAARQIAQWREQFGVTIPVSVNLSRVDLFDPELEQTLIGLVRENGLEFSSLRLEITESAYTEHSDQVIKVLESLHQKGFTIEMDDFGSGYSSLNMLSDMPIDILKIDQGFIRKMGQGDKNLRMVELILDIARSMKLLVVAEGVELEKQLNYLKQLGCDVVQGYLFSKPVPAQAFEKFLKQDSASQSV